MYVMYRLSHCHHNLIGCMAVVALVTVYLFARLLATGFVGIFVYEALCAIWSDYIDMRSTTSSPADNNICSASCDVGSVRPGSGLLDVK